MSNNQNKRRGKSNHHRVIDFLMFFYFSAEEDQKIEGCDDSAIESSPVMTRKRCILMQGFDPSAPSPFDLLAKEVLEDIFSFLDRSSLKMALLVSKRWCSIISTLPKLMEQLPLTVSLSHGSENREMLKFQRRYHIVEFRDIGKKLPKYIDNALMNIGSDVKTLYITSCSLQHKLLEVSRCFPRTENLVIDSRMWEFTKKPEQKLDATMAGSLKKLTINNVSRVSWRH